MILQLSNNTVNVSTVQYNVPNISHCQFPHGLVVKTCSTTQKHTRQVNTNYLIDSGSAASASASYTGAAGSGAAGSGAGIARISGSLILGAATTSGSDISRGTADGTSSRKSGEGGII